MGSHVYHIAVVMKFFVSLYLWNTRLGLVAFSFSFVNILHLIFGKG